MCMICDGSGNVLVEDRVDPGWPGVAFPGGYVEKGESFTDAVIREGLEGTGLTVPGLQFCGIEDWMEDDGTRYVVLLYKTGTYSGEVVSSDEGKVWRTPLESLTDLKLADHMETMLRLFCEDTVTELFFYKEDGKWTDVLK